MVLFKELVHYLMLANELCKQAVHTEYVYGGIVASCLQIYGKSIKKQNLYSTSFDKLFVLSKVWCLAIPEITPILNFGLFPWLDTIVLSTLAQK